jgi:hypothetical protein
MRNDVMYAKFQINVYDCDFNKKLQIVKAAALDKHLRCKLTKHSLFVKVKSMIMKHQDLVGGINSNLNF